MTAVDQRAGVIEVLEVSDDLIKRGGFGVAHDRISVDRSGATNDETSFPGNHPKRKPHIFPRLHKSARWPCLGPPGRFSYHNFGTPLLYWQVVPPFYRKIYDFNTRSWSYLD